jgi:AraC family transcriptional regulator of adaptative response / DNA-3-methyladenine glycosylase II
MTREASAVQLERLAECFGQPVSVDGLRRLFPRPQDLADADLSRAGIRGRRAATLRALALAACDGDTAFQPGASLEETISRLVSIRGISASSAHYIAMRALGEPDAFPSAEVVRSTGHRETTMRMRRASEAWRPWRAYAALHLCADQICADKKFVS